VAFLMLTADNHAYQADAIAEMVTQWRRDGALRKGLAVLRF